MAKKINAPRLLPCSVPLLSRYPQQQGTSSKAHAGISKCIPYSFKPQTNWIINSLSAQDEPETNFKINSKAPKTNWNEHQKIIILKFLTNWSWNYGIFHARSQHAGQKTLLMHGDLIPARWSCHFVLKIDTILYWWSRSFRHCWIESQIPSS